MLQDFELLISAHLSTLICDIPPIRTDCKTFFFMTNEGKMYYALSNINYLHDKKIKIK
jgi:hypothetical protein